MARSPVYDGCGVSRGRLWNPSETARLVDESALAAAQHRPMIGERRRAVWKIFAEVNFCERCKARDPGATEDTAEQAAFSFCLLLGYKASIFLFFPHFFPHCYVVCCALLSPQRGTSFGFAHLHCPLHNAFENWFIFFLLWQISPDISCYVVLCKASKQAQSCCRRNADG